MTHIRQATAADIPAIYELVYDLAVYEKEPEALTATVEDYHRDFAEGCFEAILAEQEGKIQGMALYYDTYSTWKGKMLYLEDFVVKTEQRGLGIGQLLFDALLEVGRSKEAKLVKWQVLEWNEPAVKFYEKNKAIIDKTWWTGKIFL